MTVTDQRFQKIQVGDGLTATDAGDGVVRIDGAGGADGAPGPPGPAGPTGPTGPTGPPGEQTTFTFSQLAPSTTWTIAHLLDRFPSVTVIDSVNVEVFPDIDYGDSDHLTLTFTAATSGKAYLN